MAALGAGSSPGEARAAAWLSWPPAAAADLSAAAAAADRAVDRLLLRKAAEGWKPAAAGAGSPARPEEGAAASAPATVSADMQRVEQDGDSPSQLFRSVKHSEAQQATMFVSHKHRTT